MLTRLLYRIVALFFYLLALASALIAIACFVALVLAGRFDFIPMGVWAVFIAWLLMDCANAAWRAGRYDPLYDSAGF